jgi:hypothetical protein
MFLHNQRRTHQEGNKEIMQVIKRNNGRMSFDKVTPTRIAPAAWRGVNVVRIAQSVFTSTMASARNSWTL